jgi:hypothetical protein
MYVRVFPSPEPELVPPLLVKSNVMLAALAKPVARKPSMKNFVIKIVPPARDTRPVALNQTASDVVP